MAKRNLIYNVAQVLSAESIDRAIGYFSPQAEQRRLEARFNSNKLRQALGLMEKKRGYDGASKGRRTSGWNATGSSANSITSSSLGTLRSRSRDLVRNNPTAKRGVGIIQSVTIGSGIIPQAQDIGGKRVASTLDKLWALWGDTVACDFDDRHDFYGIQSLAMREIAEAGECLIIRKQMRANDNLAIPLQIQMLEPEYLDTTKDMMKGALDGSRIIQGVEYDSRGKRVAYHIYETHPGDTISIPKSVRVPAKDVIHLGRVERAGQVRFIPWLASVIVKLKDFDDYEDAQLVRQKIAACFTAFVRDARGFEDYTDEQLGEKKADSNAFELLEPGLIQHLPPGKDITFGQPPEAGGYGEIAKAYLHRMAAGLDVPYAALSGDLESVNFSSSRVGEIYFRNIVSQWRNHIIIPPLCKRVWGWFVEAAELVGAVNGYTSASWTAPQFEMIDPLKETTAMKEKVKAGFMSLSEAQRKHGYDPEEVVDEIAKDNERLKQKGIKLDTSTSPESLDASGDSESDSGSGEDN